MKLTFVPENSFGQQSVGKILTLEGVEVGKVTEYDKETGELTATVDEKHIKTIESLLKNNPISISSRGNCCCDGPNGAGFEPGENGRLVCSACGGYSCYT